MNLRPSWSSQAEFSMFVTQEGDYLVCGNNENGSLCTGDLEHRADLIPLQFPEGEGGRRGEIEALASGQRHSLALMRDGRVFGWGRAGTGQLGPFSPHDHTSPVLLSFPERPVFISGGSHFSAVITEGGALYMGGDNGHGELGSEEEAPKPLPSRVPGLPPIVEVALGWYHAVARTEEGEVWSWGRNDSGEAGQGGGALTITTPTLLPPFSEKIVQVTCGGYHSLFLGEKGTLWTCGWNYYGNTGQGEGERPYTPRILFPREGGGRVKEISAGWCHSMVLLEDGSIRTWGNNSDGQLGIGSMDMQFEPVPMVFPPREGGGRGEGGAGGKMGEGEGGHPEEKQGGVSREGGEEVVGIGCCCDHSFLVTRKGDLWAWGRGVFGTLGFGDYENKMVPTRVEGIRVRLPRPRSMQWWEEVGIWLFLGREDGDSQFWGMPLEVVFHFVKVRFG